MKVSDYDRQEFIQALRELADGNGGELLDHVKCLRVDEVGDFTIFGVGAVLAMDEAGCCDAEDASGYLAALADIVEWPTCRNVHGGREMVEKECLKKENAELKAELADWKGNAEGFQPDAYMKLPVDADGVPVCIGDKVNVDGDAMTVLGYRLYNGTLLLIVKKGDSNLTYTPKPSEIRHFKYARPDSWEKLEKDAMGRACELAGSGHLRCGDCKWGKEGIGCQAMARLEILKRAKKLAGIEEEARNGD